MNIDKQDAAEGVAILKLDGRLNMVAAPRLKEAVDQVGHAREPQPAAADLRAAAPPACRPARPVPPARAGLIAGRAGGTPNTVSGRRRSVMRSPPGTRAAQRTSSKPASTR